MLFHGTTVPHNGPLPPGKTGGDIANILKCMTYFEGSTVRLRFGWVASGTGCTRWAGQRWRHRRAM